MCADDNTKARSSGMDRSNSAGFTRTNGMFKFKTTSIAGTLHGVSYMALFLLFLAQLMALFHNHSHLGGLSMFDTVMLLILKMDTVQLHKWLFPGKNVYETELAPFLLIAACTVFEALLFVNFTHAIEAITCADSSSHFSTPFLATVGLSVFVKCPLLLLSHKMSISNISSSRQYFLHFGAPLVTVSLALANHYFSPESGEVISFLDRYLAAGMCAILSVVVLPLFKQNIPFLLFDVPKGAEEAQLRVEIEKKFPNLRLNHLHIYSKWPGHEFDVFLHLAINSFPPSPAESLNRSKAAKTEEKSLQCLMHSLQLLLRGRGARRVTIQPWLTVHGEEAEQGEEDKRREKQKPREKQRRSEDGLQQQRGAGGEGPAFSACVSEKCVREDKSCCRREEEGGGGVCAGA